MKRMYLIAATMAVMLFFLCGCTDTRQRRGMVCGKRFDAAHSVTDASTVLVGDVSMANPIKTDYPDRYYLSVSTSINDTCECVEEIQVSQPVYDEARVGSTELTYIR